MTEQLLIDHGDRDAALDTNLSCIVQAPAGSGKTELLTLRYLKLLALCEQPEEVLAITFTRKAASEMRNRILAMLMDTATQARPADNAKALEQLRWQTGQQVLHRDAELHWRLLDNPGRLRVQTIDSFCHYLASQLPILSQVGGTPSVSDDVLTCFEDAISNTLGKLESESPVSGHVRQLLVQLDNDRKRVQRLLVGLLKRRDQWLSHALALGFSDAAARHYLQGNLEELINETLADTEAAFAGERGETLDLFNFAMANLRESGAAQAANFTELTRFPEAQLQSLEVYRQISSLLLTKEFQWRRTVNKNNGFPPGKSGPAAVMKQRMLALLETFSGNENLRTLLTEVQLLPAPELEEGQWRFLTSLIQVLADLAVELQLSFRRFGMIDYAQTSAAARQALGSADEPTDIALALDNRLQHILVDEFQDTSRLQLELLQQLTAGWQRGDGRSLFLVGDAMQSCYGFRNANVGIYLDVRNRGLNDLAIRPLTLKANFRSQASVVNWVNRIFSEAFPEYSDASRGAVPYSPSSPIHEAELHSGVSVNLVTYEEDDRDLALECEASEIVRHIQTIQRREPGASIAILGRARSHFNRLIPALRRAGIRWQATEIDSLASVPVVEDLLSLTRALINPADRLAWLACLRAPWCGLDSANLLKLAQLSSESSVYSCLLEANNLALLDENSQARLRAVIPILDFAFQMRMRTSLRRVVEACWTLLRGMDCCPGEQELACVSRYLELLDEQETAGSIEDLDRFLEKLQAAWVPSPARSEAGVVQLLTMHKAKGLEFDHVILPGLTMDSGRDDKALLQWHERLNRAGESQLFMAALSATGQDEDPLYTYLREEQKTKDRLESTRLLYIAVTRAIKSAALFGVLKEKEGELIPPRSNSLLARIWPQLENKHDELNLIPSQHAGSESDHLDSLTIEHNQLLRFGDALNLGDMEKELLSQQLSKLDEGPDQDLLDNEDITFDNDNLASVLGNLLHQALETYAQLADKQEFQNLLPGIKRYWRRELQRLDLGEAEVEQQLASTEDTLDNCITRPEHQWLFDAGQQDSHSELALTEYCNGFARQHVVDRCLIDKDGVRWIIDFKTGVPANNQSEAEFMTTQADKHRQQLQRYASLFEKMEDRPIKCALYLTALPALIEI